MEFTPEDTATINEWCQRYPKKKGIDMKRVRAEDGARLEEIKKSGNRTDQSIYNKAVYQRTTVLGTAPKKPSASVPRRSSGPGKYKCEICGEMFETRQGLGGHTAGHNRAKRMGANHIIKTMPLGEAKPLRMPIMPDGLITLTVPSHLLNQSLSQYVIVNTDGNYRLAKLV